MADKTIYGTTPDYSTLALWEAYLDDGGNSGSAGVLGEAERGLMRAVEASPGDHTIASGVTTSATNTVTLTTDTGASFVDDAGSTTPNFRYDTGKGACISLSGTENLVTGAQYITIEKLMITHSGDRRALSLAHANCIAQQFVVEITQTGSPAFGYWVGGFNSGTVLRNGYVIRRSATASGAAVTVGDSAGLDSLTVVRPSDLTAGGTGIVGGYSSTKYALNCISLGHSDDWAQANSAFHPWHSSADYNASGTSSDADCPGANSVEGIAIGDQFENVTDSTRDWRVKSGAGVLDVGATALSTDIIGTARPQNSVDDIGAFEFVAAGGDISLSPGQGNLVLSTTAPTVTVSGNITLSPAAAQLVLSPSTPSVNFRTALTPGQANLALSTVAPAISYQLSVYPPQGNLTLSTAAPALAVTEDQFRTPPAADLVLSTTAPTLLVTEDRDISPAAADLVLSTTAPSATVSADISLSPGQANLTLSTTAPSLNFRTVIVPGQGNLVLSATAPTVRLPIILTPTTGQLVLSTTAPVLSPVIDRQPDAAQLVLSTTAPAVTWTDDHNKSPPAAQLELTTSRPTVTGGGPLWTPTTPDSESWTPTTPPSTTWSPTTPASNTWTPRKFDPP